MPVRIVGSKKAPGPVDHRAAIVKRGSGLHGALDLRGDVVARRTEQSGPSSTLSSIGSPILVAANRSVNFFRKRPRSSRGRGTASRRCRPGRAAQSRFDADVDGLVDIGIVEHDEDIGAAEFHDRLLEMLAGLRSDDAACVLRTGQRDALDAIVCDQIRDLLAGREDVRPGALRRARCRSPAPRTRPRIAGRCWRAWRAPDCRPRCWARDAHQLIEREVPRLDRDDDADRVILDPAVAERRFHRAGARKVAAFSA